MTISNSIKETEALAKGYVAQLSPKKKGATLIGLSGDLGSGKTAFVKAVAKALGVKHTITSPTFVIEKIYRLPVRPPARNARAGGTQTGLPARNKFSKLVHIDAYRLSTAREWKTVFQSDIQNDPKALVFIEWPENVKGALPRGTNKISFKFIDERTREIKVNSKFKYQKSK